MRVSDAYIFDAAIANTGRARDAAVQAQGVVSRGTRVEHPGDDAAAAGLIAANLMASDRFAAVGKVAGMASDELVAADGALDGIATALSRAREMAVQFSSSGYTQAQTAGAAEEVGALFGQILSQLNTRFGNRYVFGGFKDGAPPFDAGGSYRGDSGVRQVEIAPDVYEQANVRADVAMGVTGGTNVLQTVQALQAALQANDLSGVQATLDGLQASIEQVAAARAQAGGAMNAFDMSVTASKLASDGAKTQGSKLADADIVDSAIQLARSQNALEASLAVTAQSFKLSLLDYL